jgi:hypothetical protein
MSLLRKSKTANASLACACQDTGEAGTFRMRVEPIQLDVRDHVSHDETSQLINAERIQGMFLPSLLKAPARAHGTGYHIHPEQPGSVAHVAQLHDLLDEHGLATRISFRANDESNAVAASLDRVHVAELCANGVVDVAVPLGQGTFRLHSTKPGRITAVEYVR